MTATATRPRSRAAKPKPAPPSPHPIYDGVIADQGVDPVIVSADVKAVTTAPFVFGTDQ